MSETNQGYVTSLYETLMNFLVVGGILVGLGFAVFLFIVALLNMLSFTYLGFMVGELIFDSQLHVLLTWFVFAVFTLYVAYLMDTS